TAEWVPVPGGTARPPRRRRGCPQSPSAQTPASTSAGPGTAGRTRECPPGSDPAPGRSTAARVGGGGDGVLFRRVHPPGQGETFFLQGGQPGLRVQVVVGGLRPAQLLTHLGVPLQIVPVPLQGQGL